MKTIKYYNLTGFKRTNHEAINTKVKFFLEKP